MLDYLSVTKLRTCIFPGTCYSLLFWWLQSPQNNVEFPIKTGYILVYSISVYPIPVRISYYMGVSLNGGTPKSSILIGFSIINHPFLAFSPYFWKHPYSFVKNPAYFILYFYTVQVCAESIRTRLWHPMALAKAF